MRNLGFDHVLCGVLASLPAGLYQMGLFCEAAWKHLRVTFEKDKTAGDLVEGLALWAPPPSQLLRDPSSLTVLGALHCKVIYWISLE